MLNNKALAYLNSKKANSILKSYEEAINTNKFIQNQGGKNSNGNKRGSGASSGIGQGMIVGGIPDNT
jgi:hypothetical protein